MEPCFQPHRLGRVPLKVITKALEIARQTKLEEARLNSLATAHHALLFAVANGAKHAKLEDFDPIGRIMKIQEAKTLINRRTAQTFLDLSSEQKIPTWVASFVDLDMIRAAAD